MSGNSGSHISMGVYVGTEWRIDCYTYPDNTPILSITAGSNPVTVSVKGREATGAAVDFARELAAKAQAFAAEVERMHAAETSNGKDAEGTTA